MGLELQKSKSETVTVNKRYNDLESKYKELHSKSKQLKDRFDEKVSSLKYILVGWLVVCIWDNILIYTQINTKNKTFDSSWPVRMFCNWSI